MSEPRLFLVRVWHDLSQFRAAVRGVDEAEPRLFNDPAHLLEFLREASALASVAAPSRPVDDARALANAGQTPRD